MIPKTIHYCWFGGKPLPESAKRCIESWKKYCPDYQIIEWNDTNYDITKNLYMKEAYECRRFAFVSDYARLDVVYSYGGIYLDTDVELVRAPDALLKLSGFCGVERDSHCVALGQGFGAEKGNPTVKRMLDAYTNAHFIVNGEQDLTPEPKRNTKTLRSIGYTEQTGITTCEAMTIFPAEYFCPKSFETGALFLTENTISIHHYGVSWYSPTERYARALRKKLMRCMPEKLAGHTAYFIAQCKYDGCKKAIKRTVMKVKGRK